MSRSGDSKPARAAGTAQEIGFDERLGRLEAIIAQLEEGGLGLEPAIECYQEGIEHLKLCHSSLESYRRRVEELTKDAEGVLKPFESDPDAE